MLWHGQRWLIELSRRKKGMKRFERQETRGSRTKTLTALLFGLAFVLCVVVLLLCSCSSYEQPGQTAAEGRRRHERVLRINQQEMMADIDRVLLLDQPSKLTDKRIP
jgi:hypothetical protein